MSFSVEGLTSTAMSVFKDRLITVLLNSPLHATQVAVVELYTSAESFSGAICLADLVIFAGMASVRVQDCFVREQSQFAIELWLCLPHNAHDFDNDPTPTM